MNGVAGTFIPASTLRVVALGGGTGLPILLRGLKAHFFPHGWDGDETREQNRLTAIVNVVDDGGSSGRLRQAYRVVPPGDIRNCLLALSDGDPTLTAIFNFRFNGTGDVSGHSLGNLILTALSQMERDFLRATNRAGELLTVRGRVLPATLDDVTLVAELDDGRRVEGESHIASSGRPIRRVCLQPERVQALPEAVAAIASADLIVIAPGSLYTSLLPILLVPDIARALAASNGRVVLVMDLMTEPGETEGYTGLDHLLTIRRHVPHIFIHDVLLNTRPIPQALLARYGAQGSVPVLTDLAAIRALGCRPLERDLLGKGPKIRHDPHKLARTILELGTIEKGDAHPCTTRNSLTASATTTHT
jgi:uncharacterized cofD-like protein